MWRILLLVVVLAGCVPVVNNDDPLPPPPAPPEDPTDVVETLDGLWNGSLLFSAGSEEESESMFILFSLDVDNDEGEITGAVTFYTTLGEICDVEGTQVESHVDLSITCEEVEAYSFSGIVTEGIYEGGYISYTVYPDGNFHAVYKGEDE